MYSYKPPGLAIKKRLQANENVGYYDVNNLLLVQQKINLEMSNFWTVNRLVFRARANPC
jgi:hypothetical protein